MKYFKLFTIIFMLSFVVFLEATKSSNSAVNEIAKRKPSRQIQSTENDQSSYELNHARNLNLNDQEMNKFEMRDIRSLKKGFNAWAGKRSSHVDASELTKDNNRLNKLKELIEWKMEESPSSNLKIYELLERRGVDDDSE